MLVIKEVTPRSPAAESVGLPGLQFGHFYHTNSYSMSSTPPPAPPHSHFPTVIYNTVLQQANLQAGRGLHTLSCDVCVCPLSKRGKVGSGWSPTAPIFTPLLGVHPGPCTFQPSTPSQSHTLRTTLSLLLILDLQIRPPLARTLPCPHAARLPSQTRH